MLFGYRHLGQRTVDLLGPSFGGTGVLYLAARIPHMVRHVVVFDTIPGAAHPDLDRRIQFEPIQSLALQTRETSLVPLFARIWRQSLLVAPHQGSMGSEPPLSPSHGLGHCIIRGP